jgi:glycosyltransferase involved in cell wall biosynthesis
VKLLIDAMPLSGGGGVQVALGLVDSLRGGHGGSASPIAWQAVVPDRICPLLPEGIAADPRILVLPKQGRGDILAAGRRLSAIERRVSPDVVFTVFGPAYFKARAPHLVGFALPNLIYDRNRVLRQAAGRLASIEDAIKRYLVRRADHHVVETDTVRRRLSERLGIPHTRISVIGNSVSPLLDQHPPTPRPKDGLFAILVPSTYYRHKNLEILPEIAAHLVRRVVGQAFEIRLTLDPASRPFMAIMADAQARGVADLIRTLGPLRLDQLAESYREASAVLLPTLREASTAVYPESFHFERPLVTSDLDFARELCGEAALFCHPQRPSDYADALADLMTEPSAGQLAERLVAAGRRRLVTAYPTPAAKFEMTIDLLKSVAVSRQRQQVAA